MIQPMLAQLFSTAFGLEPFPGLATVFGGIIVLAGLTMVANATNVVKVNESRSGSLLSRPGHGKEGIEMM